MKIKKGVELNEFLSHCSVVEVKVKDNVCDSYSVIDEETIKSLKEAGILEEDDWLKNVVDIRNVINAGGYDKKETGLEIIIAYLYKHIEQKDKKIKSLERIITGGKE